MQSRALLIDEDISNLNVFRESLSSKSVSVTGLTRATCPMISKSLDQCPCATPHYDIIISDNNMPTMNGIEFFEHIEQKGCKIAGSHKALLSGDISKEEQARAEVLGIKVFLKPCSLEELNLWVDGVLSMK